MLALGLIETKGLVGAIEAADAMLKAADVVLLEKSLASGGLVTITIGGEVSAVQASVDAAVASLERIAGVVCVSHHVIPRPDTELQYILRLAQEPHRNDTLSAMPCEAAASQQEEGSPAKVQEAQESVEEEPTQTTGAVAAPEEHAAPVSEEKRYRREQLKSMSLNKLRQLAKGLELGLSREQISAADKKTLLDAICQVTRQEKE